VIERRALLREVLLSDLAGHQRVRVGGGHVEVEAAQLARERIEEVARGAHLVVRALLPSGLALHGVPLGSTRAIGRWKWWCAHLFKRFLSRRGMR
jgi:hypothetical protein